MLAFLKRLLSPPKPGMRFAIVNYCGVRVAVADLPAIAAAITKQAQQHVALPPPTGWGISASVRYEPRGITGVAGDEIVIGLFTHADQPGALGYHDRSPSGLPLVKVFPLLDDPGNLPVTISHEVLETMVDPEGNVAFQAPDGTFWAAEICDGTEGDSYFIDGIRVSNWATPLYFAPAPDGKGKLDWMGLCTTPLEIRPGGYNQSWDPSSGWKMSESPKAMRSYRQHAAGRTARRRAGFSVKP